MVKIKEQIRLFFEVDTDSKDDKRKNKQVGLHQTKKLLHSKLSTTCRSNLLNGRKYLQIVYLII